MSQFFFVTLGVLSLILPFYLYRSIAGPTVFDRLIGLNGIATKAILLLVLIGAYDGQIDMFVDISLGYGLINLIGAVAVAKYLETRELKA